MKKVTLILGTMIAISGLLYWIARLLAPGSYPYAERYELHYPEKEVVQAVDSFKKATPQYKVPERMKLKDGRSNNSDHWYHLYFYYQEEDQVVYAWIRPLGNSSTTLAFVAINYGQQLDNWKEINNDFSWADNSAQKRKFQDKILSEIKRILARRQ